MINWYEDIPSCEEMYFDELNKVAYEDYKIYTTNEFKQLLFDVDTYIGAKHMVSEKKIEQQLQKIKTFMNNRILFVCDFEWDIKNNKPFQNNSDDFYVNIDLFDDWFMFEDDDFTYEELKENYSPLIYNFVLYCYTSEDVTNDDIDTHDWRFFKQRYI